MYSAESLRYLEVLMHQLPSMALRFRITTLKVHGLRDFARTKTQMEDGSSLQLLLYASTMRPAGTGA